MDKIFIKGMQVETIIGIFEWEREVRQLINLDLEIDYDLRKAGKTDNLKNTLNYKEISKRVISLVQECKTRLIEGLAEKIAKTILNEFDIKRIKVSVKKPGALRGSQSVGVTIVRP